MYRCLIIAVVVASVSSASVGEFSFNSYSWNRIVGGQDVDKPIPYMVSIVHYGSHHCGGAIINERTILTAAHCLFGINKRLTKVRVGSIYQHVNDGILIPIANWKIHEHFESTTMDYDIAIIFLAKDIQMEQGVIEAIPMAEHKTEIPDGTKAIVSGWGLLEMNGPEPGVLQVATVPIIGHKTCSDLMNDKITKNMICAGYMEGGIDACQMDSGGPLVAQKKLVGIVSWGDGCARPERPGIYAKVSELRDWVDDKINSVKFLHRKNY